MLDPGVAHDQVGKELSLDFAQQVGSGQAGQVIKPVCVLQLDHLHGKDEVEGGPQHAAGHLLFGQTADPEIDVVEPEIARHEGIVVDGRTGRFAQGLRIELAIGLVGTVAQGVPTGQAVHRALYARHQRVQIAVGVQHHVPRVGHDEVFKRLGVQQTGSKLVPGVVRLQRRQTGAGKQGGTHLVEGAHARVTAPHDVERGQVQRQAHQVVAQSVGHPLVNGVAHLARHAQGHLACRVGFVGQGVDEGLDQAHGVVLAVGQAREGVETGHGHGFGEHGVAKAVHRVRKFGRDGRVDGDVVACKQIDVGAELAHELAKDHVLVLHLGDEFGGLKNVLARPNAARALLGVAAIGIERHAGLEVRHHAVVFGMEHVVDHGQTHVFVGSPIARDQVGIEQCSRLGVARRQVTGVGVDGSQHTVRDVVQKRMARGLQQQLPLNGLQICTRDVLGGAVGQQFQSRGVGCDKAVLHVVNVTTDFVSRHEPHARSVHEGHAFSTQTHHRNVGHVFVVQLDVDHRCVLHRRLPGGHAVSTAIVVFVGTAADQAAGDFKAAVDRLVLADEGGVTGHRAIGLAQVHKGRGDVDTFVDLVVQHQTALCIQRGRDACGLGLGVDGRHHVGRGGPGLNVDGDAVQDEHAAQNDVRLNGGHPHHTTGRDARVTGHIAVFGQAQGLHQTVCAGLVHVNMHRVGALGQDVVFVTHNLATLDDGVIRVVVQRVTGQKRHQNQAVGPLFDEIQPVVKKLAHQGGDGAVGQRVGGVERDG